MLVGDDDDLDDPLEDIMAEMSQMMKGDIFGGMPPPIFGSNMFGIPQPQKAKPKMPG